MQLTATHRAYASNWSFSQYSGTTRHSKPDRFEQRNSFHPIEFGAVAMFPLYWLTPTYSPHFPSIAIGLSEAVPILSILRAISPTPLAP